MKAGCLLIYLFLYIAHTYLIIDYNMWPEQSQLCSLQYFWLSWQDQPLLSQRGGLHGCALYGGFHITQLYCLSWETRAQPHSELMSQQEGALGPDERRTQQNRSLTWQSGDLHLLFVLPEYSSEPLPSELHLSTVSFLFLFFAMANMAVSRP